MCLKKMEEVCWSLFLLLPSVECVAWHTHTNTLYLMMCFGALNHPLRKYLETVSNLLLIRMLGIEQTQHSNPSDPDTGFLDLSCIDLLGPDTSVLQEPM